MARIFRLWFLYLTVAASAISLTDLLKSRSDLSVWYRLIQPQWETLNEFRNITFLAPNNDAMLAYFNTPQVSGCASTDAKVLQALTLYHTLEQEYDSFPGYSDFTTVLADRQYAAGQITNDTWITTPMASDPEDRTVNVSTLISGLNTYSNLLAGPIPFSGGVLYIVDTILQLPANTSSTLVAAGYTAFAGALRFTNTEQIANTLGVNVNVPTNEAFQEIGNIASQLTPDEARAMVLYHLQNGSDAVGSGNPDGTSMTLEGTNLTNTDSDQSVSYTNNAMVVNSAYFFSSNSVNIWVLNKVLNPKNTTAPINSTAWPNASKVASIPFVTNAPGLPQGLCDKPVWFDSVFNAERRAHERALIGGLVGTALAIALVATGLFFSRRQNKRIAGPHQEIDGMETFGRPELKGYSHVPSEMDTDMKHELESAETPVFELPVDQDVRPELATQLPRLELPTQVSETHELVSPLSPEAERFLSLNQQFESSKAIALSPS